MSDRIPIIAVLLGFAAWVLVVEDCRADSDIVWIQNEPYPVAYTLIISGRELPMGIGEGGGLVARVRPDGDWYVTVPDLEPPYSATLIALGEGELATPAKNTIFAYRADACRFDADGDGFVGARDLSRMLRTQNSECR